MIDISALEFYDKKGYPYNFTLEEDNVWRGTIVLPKVSIGLYATAQIFIMEWTNDGNLVFPYDDKGGELSISWDILNEYVDEFFLYNFDASQIISETSSLAYTPQDGPDANVVAVNRFDEYYVALNNTNEVDYTNDVKCLPIYIAFSASPDFDGTSYERTLIINYGITRVAEIRIYAQSVDEDERLKVLTQNLGYNIKPEDEVIFKESDIKEELTDYQLLNEKRKEILMEGHNIYPYIGSYKALINAIKFFGYDNVSIIEYWRNVNSSDENYGKLFRSSKYSLINHETLTVSGQKINLPNRDYKKVNRVTLVYDINRLTDDYDRYELPLTEEHFTYTIEEAIIKLFALRRKLDKDFMPGSSRISDIVGEAFYFGLVGIENTTGICRIDSINSGIKVDFDVYPRQHVYITDDRGFDRYLFDQYKDNVADELDVYVDKVLGYKHDKLPFETDQICVLSNISEMSIDELDALRETDIENESTIDSILKSIDMNSDSDIDSDEIDINWWEFEYSDRIIKAAFTNYQQIDAYKEYLKLDTYKEDNDLSFSDYYINRCIPVSAKVILQCKSFISKEVRTGDIPLKQLFEKGTISEYDRFGYNHLIWHIQHDQSDWSTTIEGSVNEYNDVFVRLPYIGTYSVTLTIIDSYNCTSTKTLSSYITVDPLQIEISGLYHDARPLPNNYEYVDEVKEMIQEILYHDIVDAIPEHYSKEDLDQSMPVYTPEGEVSTYGPYKMENTKGLDYNYADNLNFQIVNFIADESTARFVSDGVAVKPFTWMILGCNFCYIAGKKDIKWTLTNEITKKVITHEGKYLTYLFKDEGKYNVKVEMKDTNNNEYKLSRNLVVVSKTADYNRFMSSKDLNKLIKIK